MATLSELERAMRNAHQAGDFKAARKLAAVVGRGRDAAEATRIESPMMAQMLELEGEEAQVAETVLQEPGPTLGQKALGVLETGATLGTGMVGGLAGQVEGSIEGILLEAISGDLGTYDAAQRIEKLAMERAQRLTYEPRTEVGQEYTQGVGEALAPLAALPPLAEAQMVASAAGKGAKQAQQATRQGAQQAAQKAQPLVRQATQAAQEVGQKVRERMPAPSQKGSPDLSMGAAQVPKSALRQAQADELPVRMKLTEGQKTRDFETQRFERETAKTPEGAPIRERFEDQNLQLQQNMDEFIDATGAQITNLRGVGEFVDKALRSRAARDKVRIRTLYKEAEKSGEMSDPVRLDTFVKHLVDNAPEAEVANVLKAVRAKALQLGAATEGSGGQLTAHPVSIKDAELLRRSINNATNAEPTNIRQAAIMKRLIDDTTEGAGGARYRQARAARVRYGKDYENIGLVKNLLGLKKGSGDRAIALEDVVRKSILDPSAPLDTVRQLRRLLQTKSGTEGAQAWRELQGATLRHMQDQMLKGVTTNQRGDRVVSPAQLDRVISQLDKAGKLEFIFGKKGAEQLTTINDVAKVILTSPPGAVNTSNTATVLAGLMDVAVTGTTGVPAPLATSLKFLTSKIKDAKLKARIKQTLGDN